MWCFYIKNKVTGKTDCVFGYSWEDAKGVIRQLIIMNGTLRLRLTKTNKKAKALFYCIAVIYDIIYNISEILYIIYYLKKSKSYVKI